MIPGGAPAVRWEGSDLVLRVRVQPRARSDRIGDLDTGSLKVSLTAAPVDGVANARLLQVLAKAFGVAKSRVQIEAGATGRDKRVRIEAPTRLPPGIPPAS